jgi:N-acetylglutamate synthase-like GNAT family acetyltransferase
VKNAHASRTKKIRRRRTPGQIVIQQTRDRATIAAMLEKARAPASYASCDADCFLVAYFGDAPVGLVRLLTQVDAGLIDPVFVIESMRRRGIAASLVQAARVAAHTRGARMLYATGPANSVDYFARFGFTEAAFTEVVRLFGRASIPERTTSEGAAECRTVFLDISRDGLIER